MDRKQMLWISKCFYWETVKVVGITGLIIYRNLLIIFLEFLKHRVEFFLLFGRNKLGASTKCIADQPELRWGDELLFIQGGLQFHCFAAMLLENRKYLGSNTHPHRFHKLHIQRPGFAERDDRHRGICQQLTFGDRQCCLGLCNGRWSQCSSTKKNRCLEGGCCEPRKRFCVQLTRWSKPIIAHHTHRALDHGPGWWTGHRTATRKRPFDPRRTLLSRNDPDDANDQKWIISH